MRNSHLHGIYDLNQSNYLINAERNVKLRLRMNYRLVLVHLCLQRQQKTGRISKNWQLLSPSSFPTEDAQQQNQLTDQNIPLNICTSFIIQSIYFWRIMIFHTIVFNIISAWQVSHSTRAQVMYVHKTNAVNSFMIHSSFIFYLSCRKNSTLN